MPIPAHWKARFVRTSARGYTRTSDGVRPDHPGAAHLRRFESEAVLPGLPRLPPGLGASVRARAAALHATVARRLRAAPVGAPWRRLAGRDGVPARARTASVPRRAEGKELPLSAPRHRDCAVERAADGAHRPVRQPPALQR